jgi:hypothetical protein
MHGIFMKVVLHHYFLTGGVRPRTIGINASGYGDEHQTGKKNLHLYLMFHPSIQLR